MGACVCTEKERHNDNDTNSKWMEGNEKLVFPANPWEDVEYYPEPDVYDLPPMKSDGKRKMVKPTHDALNKSMDLNATSASHFSKRSL